jgi:hypothetical protein
MQEQCSQPCFHYRFYIETVAGWPKKIGLNSDFTLAGR